MGEVLLDALLDSLKVLGVAFVLYIIISFLEEKIASSLTKKSKLSPLIASALGLIPQCGLGVVASDLYVKRHITMGTLIALFLSCSDEALPIILTSDKAITLIPIIIIKFVIGFIVGFVVDLFYTKSKEEIHEHMEHCHHHMEEEIHVGCCNHHIEEDEEESKLHKHLLHPLLHSLKIFGYVLVINIVLGTLIYLIGGEEVLANFLANSRWLAPLFSTLIGLIPNCAASVVIAEVYLVEGASFMGACISGLLMNAGLGLLFLFKNKGHAKENFTILAIMFSVSIVVGYVTTLILTFI